MVGSMPKKITDFKRPGTSLVMLEGHHFGSYVVHPEDRCFVSHHLWNLTQYYVHSPGVRKEYQTWLRHNGSTNALFFDGHVIRVTPKRLGERIWRRQEFFEYDHSPHELD